MEINLEIDEVFLLGEGPLWHKDKLIFVDILDKCLLFYDPKYKKLRRYYVEDYISMVVPCENNYLIALKSGLKIFDGHELEDLCELQLTSDFRFNDGKCDSSGNLWIGSMSMSSPPDYGKLYRIKAGEYKVMLDQVSLSNGLCWSLDNDIMYHIDTLKNKINYYSLEENNIQYVDELKIPSEYGKPDGMTIDNEGNLWVAMWNGGCVTRWDPNSKSLMEFIHLPAQNVTSVTFGGDLLDTLYITSANIETNKKYPHNGKVFSVKTKYKGVPCETYKK
jgi:sugar lactone lactonase YvrE